MSKRRSVDLMRRVHGFSTKSRRRIFHQGHMVPELHAKATGRFEAGIGDHANEHQALDSMLLELLIQIRVRKTTLSPMLFDHNIALELTTARIHRQDPIPLALQVTRHPVCGFRGIRRGSYHCNGSGLGINVQELLAPSLFHRVIIPLAS
jgi:hypothetical protein